MTPENYNQLEDILTGKNVPETNVVQQMIGILSSPIAKRNGVVIPAEDCKIWVEELERFLKEIR